jgi:hypothetical protein
LPQNMWKYECRESGGTSWYGAPYKCSCGATSKYVSWFNTIMEAMAWYQKHYGLKPNGGRVGDILTFLKRLPHSRKNFCGVSIRGLVGTRQGMIREGERSSTVPIERTIPRSHLIRVSSPEQRLEQRAFRRRYRNNRMSPTLPMSRIYLK